MEGRIVAELHARVFEHVTRVFPTSSRHFMEDGTDVLLVMTHQPSGGLGHARDKCCVLTQPTGEFPAVTDEHWGIWLHCEEETCPIGARLMWTTAGRFAPPLAELVAAPAAEDDWPVHWPRSMSVNCSGRCVVCGLQTEDVKVDWPTTCNDAECYLSLAGFVRGAFARWALSNGDAADALPRELRSMIEGHLVALTAPFCDP